MKGDGHATPLCAEAAPGSLQTRPTTLSISYLQLHEDASFPQTVLLRKRAWAPPPQAFDGFATAPPRHAQAPHWLRRSGACSLPLPISHHQHFSQGIPPDEAPRALPIWSWTKGLRMQMIRGAFGLPDLPARGSLQGFQVQHIHAGGEEFRGITLQIPTHMRKHMSANLPSPIEGSPHPRPLPEDNPSPDNNKLLPELCPRLRSTPISLLSH